MPSTSRFSAFVIVSSTAVGVLWPSDHDINKQYKQVKTTGKQTLSDSKQPRSVQIPQGHERVSRCVSTKIVYIMTTNWPSTTDPASVPESSATDSESCHYNTHTHTFNGPLSRTTRVSRYQKGKPIWIYWSKSQWVAVASAGPYASLHLAQDRQPCQHPTTQFFTGRMPFLPPNQQRQSTEGITAVETLTSSNIKCTVL